MKRIIDLNNNTPAVVTLTATMLNKAIIDANNSVRNFSKLCGIDFDEMQSGDRATVNAEFLDGTETVLSFYRTKNQRGDRRFSIKGIKQQAEAEGLDEIFKAAGAEWREAGCSMCLGMNGDTVPSGQLSVSTSNRNFEGRQGIGARTILASPLTVAASAIAGHVADPRPYLDN